MKTIKDFNSNSFAGCMASEKFDGVQGIWDGQTLKTRSGNKIAAPEWWTKHLPKKKLIGELWIGRGCFDLTRSIVMSKNPDDAQYWDDIRFLIFDTCPDDLGPYAENVKHIRIQNKFHFKKFYQDVLDKGGEGVVLISKSGERFKEVPIRDDDGELIGFKKGRGRNSKRIGTFILKLRSGRKLNLGNGLDDTLRKKPPCLGSIIKFTYRGFTSTGLPRHTSFAGLRAEQSLNF
jgi:DNA ligase-1